MNFYYSALLSLCCVLVFSRIALALSLDIKHCVVPQNFTMEISKNENAVFYEADLTIIMDFSALKLTSYEGENSFNIEGNNVNVSFSGIMHMESDDQVKRSSAEPQVLFQRYIDMRVVGIAQRETNSSDIDEPMDSCRIVLLSNEIDRPGMTGRIPNEIHRLAEACIEPDLCQIVNQMKPEFKSKLPDENESNLLKTCPEPFIIVPDGCEQIFDEDIVQPIANKAVDVALDQISEHLRLMNGGTFPIPDMEKKFSTGVSIFKTNGYFKATNGTFGDLTTIRRTSDVSLSHNAMKVNVACEFGLKIADLRYPHYELKYGIINVSGAVSGTVNDTTLMIRASIDYNRKRCRILMENLRITKLGNMELELTGLSPLNWLSAKLLNWITMSWRDKIVSNLERQFMRSVKKQLSSFDCEKYRP